jgi:hypothetical protein
VAHRSFLSLFAVAALAVACGAREEPSKQSLSARPPAAYSTGSMAFGLDGGAARLAAPPVTPLAGWLTPAGVPSADGRYLAYNTWKELRSDDPALSWADQGIEPGDALATPSIRLYDGAGDRDEVLEDGAFSVAWRSDGALAYFKGLEPDYRAGVPYVGKVVVRSSLEAEPQVWSTEPGRYIVAAWAGPMLVAYREHEGEALDVVVFDGPSKMRVLAPGSTLVAVSPDGAKAFVERGPAHGRPSVRILDVATGETLAALDLTKVDTSVGVVSYAGDWLDRRVVASSASGLAIFRVGRKAIRLEQTLPIAVTGAVAEPRFSGPDRVTAWTSVGRRAVFLDCDLAATLCERVVPLPSARGTRGFPAWRRPLYNPSRPQ